MPTDRMPAVRFTAARALLHVPNVMKRLILCCDGTWNRADQAHEGTPSTTTVVKLAYRIAKHDAAGMPQVILYDQGVGTGNSLDRDAGLAFDAEVMPTHPVTPNATGRSTTRAPACTS